MSDISDLLERFRRGPELLASALTGAAGAELDFKPSEGKWSVRQIMAHTSDAELVGAERFRRVLAEENPSILGYDQDAWARNLDYDRRKTSQALEMFRRVRAENHELLKDLPETAFQRTCQHSERGSMSLADLLKIYANHAEKHAQQIRAVREQYRATRSAKV